MIGFQPCDFCLEEAKQDKVVRIARRARYQIKMNSGELLHLCEKHFYEYMGPNAETADLGSS